MIRIEAGSSIKREIVIGDLEKPVQTEINSEGISFWISGNRKRVIVSWKQVVLAGRTGQDVPAFLMDKPLELLRYQITKAQRKST